MVTERLRVWKGDVEITNDIEVASGLRTLGGFCAHDLVYVAKDMTGHPSAPEYVGRLVCGYPEDFAEGYRFEVEKVDEQWH